MVAAIVSPEFALVISESEVPGEQLGVCGETGVQRIASAMHDPRTRKDPMYEAEVKKIAQILVDDSSGPRRAAPQFFERGLGDRARPRIARLEKRAQLHQFTGPVDLGMRGKNMFDPGRAAARHSHDEDRHI